MIADLHQLISSYALVAISLSAAFIALLVYNATIKIARMNFTRDVYQMLNDLNILISQDEKMWEIRKAFRDGHGKIDPNDGKIFHLISILTNLMNCIYTGMNLGYVNKGIATGQIDFLLRSLSSDKEGYLRHLELTHDYKFGNFLRERLKQI